MDSSPTPESSLLQQRLQQRMRSAIPALDTSLHRPQSGRDDAIFDDLDDPMRPSRKSSGHFQMASPTSAGQSHHVQNRRTSYISPSTTSSGRSMGVREMDSHVDKLSKENFDLKLRLYKSQERSQGLEKRIKELEQVKADNDELADLNSGLMHELETYDRAVDEAVVKICDLEGKISDLQGQLDDLRPRTATQQSSAPSVGQPMPEQLSFVRPSPRRRTNSLGDISQRPPLMSTAAAPLDLPSEAATPRRAPSSRNPPSFLEQTGPDTKALRSLFRDGERSIRPLPSRETLLTELEEDDLLRSPAQSMLSETEFRSIYGDKDVSPERRRRASVDGPTESPPRELLAADRSRLARTNRWVNDRSMSPDLHRPKPVRQSTSPTFQSLGGVLHPANAAPSNIRVDKSRRRVDDPDFQQNPLFGRQNLPPTPDTMLTHPSTHSSSSFVRDEGIAEDLQTPTAAGATAHSLLPATLAGDLHASAAGVYTSMLPKELDAYASDSDDEHGPVHLNNTSFGRELLRPNSYYSDESMSRMQPASRGAQPFMATNLFDSQHARPSSASQSSTSSPRFASIPLRTLNHITFESPPQPPIHKRSTSATPTQAAMGRPRPHSDYEPLAPGFSFAGFDSTPVKKDAPLPPPHTDGPFVKRTNPSDRRPTTPKATDGSADIAEQTASAPSRAEMIRQRVAKLGRRNRSSQDASSRPSSSSTVRHGRNGSFGGRTKQFFRRNSNSQGQPTSPKSPSRVRRDTKPTDDEEADEGAGRAAFLSAAQAAAPYLDLLGNTRKEPLRGINTGIPIPPSMLMSPPKTTQGVLPSALPRAAPSSSEDNVSSRRASGMKLFPRRGKDGEEVTDLLKA